MSGMYVDDSGTEAKVPPEDSRSKPTVRLSAPVLLMGLLVAGPAFGQTPKVAYRAPSHDKLAQCYFDVLTRGLTLTSEQQARIRLVIIQFMDSLPIARGMSDWRARVIIRDSAVRTLLVTRNDSLKFEENLRGERRYFDSGICHG